MPSSFTGCDGFTPSLGSFGKSPHALRRFGCELPLEGVVFLGHRFEADAPVARKGRVVVTLSIPDLTWDAFMKRRTREPAESDSVATVPTNRTRSNVVSL